MQGKLPRKYRKAMESYGWFGGKVWRPTGDNLQFLITSAAILKVAANLNIF